MSVTEACHHAFEHTAVLYDGVDDLVAQIAPTIATAVALGDAVVVTVDDAKWHRLVDELGADAEAVDHLTPADPYSRPVVALDTFDRFMTAALDSGARQVWAFGELPIGGLVPPAEWLRYEAAATEIFCHLPARLVCLYEMGSLPAPVLEAVRVTHEDAAPRDDWTGGDRAPAHVPSPLATIDANPDELVESVPSVARARRVVHALLDGVLADERVADAELVVSELTGNAIRHGTGPVTLSVWVGPELVEIEVSDHGDGPDDPFAGLRLPTPEPGGLGLWISGLIADRLMSAPPPHGPGWVARATFVRG